MSFYVVNIVQLSQAKTATVRDLGEFISMCLSIQFAKLLGTY